MLAPNTSNPALRHYKAARGGIRQEEPHIYTVVKDNLISVHHMKNLRIHIIDCRYSHSQLNIRLICVTQFDLEDPFSLY